MIAPHAPIYSPLGADPDFYDLVDFYVDEMPERVVRLQELFVEESWDELRRLAHQIKGAAGSYGFHPITPAAARLEMSIVERRAETEIEAALRSLLSLCTAIRAGASPDAQFSAR